MFVLLLVYYNLSFVGWSPVRLAAAPKILELGLHYQTVCFLSRLEEFGFYVGD